MRTIKVKKPASKGIVIAKAFIVVHPDLKADTRLISNNEKEIEALKFEVARKKAANDLSHLAKTSDIFAAHLDVAEDEVLKDAVCGKINNDNKNAQLALEESCQELCEMFESLDDEYLRERAADVKDVCNRIQAKCKGVNVNPFEGITGEVIAIAKDLSPSDTANMDFSKIKGFITEVGGVTSHVSIMARSMEIPAIVGVADCCQTILEGQLVLLDAVDGVIIVEPDEETVALYEEKAAKYLKNKKELEALNNLPAETLDGKIVELCANVGSQADVENAVRHGAEGIGLFRSEFLYMESKAFPTEQEQFEAYKKAVETLKKSIIIRTLDIGGDKSLSYYKFDQEDNPFLGWRAIRISLDLKDVFKTQLRALLRASAFGDIKIMYPMIISVDEFLMANEILEECKKELRNDNIAFNDSIQTGIMVETPAAVICAEDLAKVADFFSIGTNDLTQYMLAVDRGNRKISRLYNSFHPVVLRSIRTVIEAGHKYGIKVCMCGEFASDEKAVPLLLGMGLDEFSITASEIASIRHLIRNLNQKACKEKMEEICAISTVEGVMAALENNIFNAQSSFT